METKTAKLTLVRASLLPCVIKRTTVHGIAYFDMYRLGGHRVRLNVVYSKN